MQSVKQQG